MVETQYYFDVTISIRDKGIADTEDTIDAEIVCKSVIAKDGHHAAAKAMQRLDKRWGIQGWSMAPDVPQIREVYAVNQGVVTA